MSAVGVCSNMSGPAPPVFDSDVRRRIYEFVERNGTASPSDIRHSVRVDAGPPASKPARSSDSAVDRTPMPVTELREHLTALEEAGYIDEEGGKYRVAFETSTTVAHEVEGGTVTIRPARQEDLAELAAVIRQVAGEETYIVAGTIAEAIDHEETLLRHNERESRVFFVATFRSDGSAERAEADEGTAVGAGKPTAEQEIDGEIVGWVHLGGPRLEELRHTAQLTLGVLSGHRRDGVGRRLLEHGLQWAENADYEKIYQTLPATNENAIDFLESQDWTVEATHDRQYRIGDEYVDEVLLSTWL